MANKNPRVAPFWSPVPATLALLLLLLGAATLLLGAVRADAATTLQVAPAGNDSGDCVANACATIGYAVGQAAGEDTIDVAAGSYDEEVVITVPGLTLQGAGSGTVLGPAGPGVVEQTAITLADGVDGVTIRDLTVVSRAQYNPAILASGDEAIDDLTLERVSATGIGPSTPPTTVANGLEAKAPGSGWQILESSFADNYLGVFVSSDMTDVTVRESSFDRNRSGFYVERSLPLSVASTGEIDGLEMTDTSFDANEYVGLYFEGLSNAVLEGVTVTGTGAGVGSLPSGARALVLNLKAGDGGNVAVTDSTFSGSVNEGILIQARGWAGDSPDYVAAPAALDGFELIGSTVTGNGGPGLIVNNQSTLSGVKAHANRFAGNGLAGHNVTAPVSGIFAREEAGGAPTVDAAENWFACNGDPAGAGCAAVNANVEAPTWLVLGAGVAFPVLGPGEQTTVVAAIESSAGGDPLLPLPDGAEAQFSSGLGSFEPASEPLLSGVTSSTFTAGAATGSGVVTVAVDGVAASAPITVRPPDTVPEPPPHVPDPAPLPEPPPAAPQPAPEPPAIQALAGKGPALVPSGGVLAVATVSCAAESCAVRPQGAPSVKVAGKSFKVRVKVPKTLAAGGSAKVRVVLPKPAREALTEAGKGRLRLKLRVVGSDGSTRTMTLTVALKSKGNGGKRG